MPRKKKEPPTYSKEYEWELYQKLQNHAFSDEDILQGFFHHLTPEESCAVMEDICRENEIEL